MRLLHARTRRRNGRSPASHAESFRRRDPRGALRQPLPVHRLREDLRCRAAGGRRVTEAVPRTLQLGRVGDLVPRADAPPKVKGEFAYASDLIVPGMLW